MKSKISQITQAFMYPTLSILLVFGLWWGVVQWHLVPATLLPSPAMVGQAALAEFNSGRLLSHLYASGGRLLAGFAIGGLVGVLLGLMLGVIKGARDALLPIIETLRPIPPLAWIPLALIWFGIDEESKIFLIALTSSFPILITTMKGVEQVDSSLLRAALSLDVSPQAMIFKVILPAASPDILTGLRLGWTLAITILVGAEMIAASSGLGFLIMDGMNNGRFDQVILGILILGLISVLTDALFAQISKGKLLRWHAGIEKATV